MALTPSTMIPLGTPAPKFTLPDAISDKHISLDKLKSDKATVIMFICNHCPFVKHIQNEVATLARDYQKKGISFVAINSNDAENYPEDSFEQMKKVARTFAYPFPYLYDESQEVAKAYHAACTPEFYIFNSELLCVYRGQFDDSRPGNNIKPSGVLVQREYYT